VVWFSPGEKHWHRATPTTPMTHIAIQEALLGEVMMGLATAFTLVTLALLYSNLAGDYRGVQLLSWLQILGNGALAAAMWWLSSKFPAHTPPPKGTPKSTT
jgi:hypothetical protein